MARKQFGIKLDEELVGKIDVLVEAAEQSRTEFVEAALRRALGEGVSVGRFVDLPAPEKPSKYTPAEMAALRFRGARNGFVYESSAEMRARTGAGPVGRG